MIDLHTHTFMSDGQLIPSELARRAEVLGYRYLGISDHVDSANIELVVPCTVQMAAEINPHVKVKVIPGAELTHVPPPLISALTKRARDLGAVYIVVHGESEVEPVAPGTNRAAIEAGAEILAHPGLIAAEDAERAAKNNVLLEITSRRGHSLTNGHVARVAKQTGAGLILNTDAHLYTDLIDLNMARVVALGAGLDDEDFKQMRQRAMDLISRIGPPWA